MSECALYVTAKGSRLRDVVSKEQLQAHMQQYGEVKEAEIPWKQGDKRSFGFLTFKGQAAGMQAVEASPHAIGEVEVICDFKRQGLITQTEDPKGNTGLVATTTSKKKGKMSRPSTSWEADGEPPVADFLVK